MKQEDIINIMAIENSSQLGGANFSLLSLAKGLQKGPFSQTIVCPAKGPMCNLCIQNNIPYVVINRARPNKFWPFPFRARIRTLKKYGRQLNIKLIHSNATSSYIAAGVAANELQIPVVMHVRCLTSEKDFRWIFSHSPSPDAIVFISDYIRKKCAPIIHSFILKKCLMKTIYNPIDDAMSLELKNKAHDMRNEFVTSKDTILVSMISNFNPNKGHLVVIKAIQLLLKKGYDVKLLFCGKDIPGHDGFEQYLKSTCETEIEHGKIKFLGFRDDVNVITFISDIIVCASKNEAFGRSCAEGMMLSKPIVATSDGGYKEQVIVGETGFLIPYEDHLKLAEALEKLFLNSELRERMGQVARKRAKSLFHTKTHVKKIEKLYEGLLNFK